MDKTIPTTDEQLPSRARQNNMSARDRRIQNTVKDLLFNMAETENNNKHVTREQIMYYRGIILATCAMLQSTYNIDWNAAMKKMNDWRLPSSDRVFQMSLPDSWKEK